MKDRLGMTLTHGKMAVPLSDEQVELILTFLEFHEGDDDDAPYDHEEFDNLRRLIRFMERTA